MVTALPRALLEKRLLRRRLILCALALVGALNLPLLLLHAREDALVPPAAAENLAAAMPGARFKVYEQADHFFPIRRPVEVAADILAFMGERA